jgi:hypothetical protein
MTSKIDHAGADAHTLANPPGLIRSTFALATRMITFWTARSGVEPNNTTPAGTAGATIEEILEQLEGEHFTFPNVSTRSGTIDYVVLSKEHGFFLLETKPHSGRVSVVDCRLRVNGKLPEKDFVAQTLRNTYWLIEEIRSATGMEAAITPLLVFTNASVDTERPLKGIPITNRESLLLTIRKNGEPMPQPLWEAREKISALLRMEPIAAAA